MSLAATDLKRSDLERQLRRGLGELDIALDSAQSGQLLRYLALVEKWNKVYSITAIHSEEKMVSVHLLDSLSIAPYLSGKQVLDVGSGAGLPGIPLAIAKPELKVTLLDSNHKKAAFLRHAVAELGLRNVEVVCERVETWRPARKFDFIVSRALGKLAEFVALAGHLLAPDGVLAAMKGTEPVEEMKNLPPDFRVKQVVPLTVPGLDAERHLVLIERA